MVRYFDALLVGAATLATVAVAQVGTPECGVGYGNCPQDKPCCGQYGNCGLGAFCLAGCDPIHSFKSEACVPNPVCKNLKSTFKDNSRLISRDKYLGDATKHDWVTEGKMAVQNDLLYMTMEPETVGGVVSSTGYLWYGKMSATLKTSRGAGVVSSFITMSNMKDEIDYEWVGAHTDITETNYYYHGWPIYGKGTKTKLSNTNTNWHTYEVDWSEDRIIWRIDGQEARTLEKKETYNATSKQYDYPQTPSRVQLSLWPGGAAGNAKGTVDWAGGFVDWQHEDIKKYGYYFVQVKELSIQCYDPPKGTKKTGSKSYVYTDMSGRQSGVAITDQPTVLKSLVASGLDMDAVPDGTQAEDAETIPGLSGAGTSAGHLQGGGPDGSGGGNAGGVASDYDSNDFEQGAPNGGSGSEATTGRQIQGSMLAIVVAFAAIMLI